MDLRVLVLVLVTSLIMTSSGERPRPCGDRDSVVVRGGQRQSDGSLFAEDGASFPPGCYWNSTDNVILGCTGKFKPCLWKCCPENQAMDEYNKCHKSNNTLLSTFAPPPTGSFNTSQFALIHGVPCGSQSFEVEAESDRFTVYDNGSLFVDNPDDDDVEDELFPSGEFCRDVLVLDGEARIVYFGCIEDQPKHKLKFLINSIGCIISLPFLMATLVVYAVIPELRNLHGKCLMSHVASLCVAFVCLALIQLGIDLLNTEGCIATALIGYFFLLASFLWLNVMCFDIWWTFSGYRSKIGPKDPRDQQKFVYYSVYAWGAAAVFLCVCATMQFQEGDMPEKYLRPHFGVQSCWFDDGPSKWAYFNGPVAVLLGCNLLFFILTALSLWKIKKQTAVLNESKENRRNSIKETNELRFNLYLKLFVVMGVPWTLEIISSAVGGPEYLWWVTDLANVLVGIPIFIIFVWKSKVRKIFWAKINMRMGSSAETSGYELS